MPLEKKYRHVQSLQSQNLWDKGNSIHGNVNIFVNMAVRRISLPEFPENPPLRRCAKPDFLKSGFAMMQHASGKKIRVCATLQTSFSPEF